MTAELQPADLLADLPEMMEPPDALPDLPDDDAGEEEPAATAGNERRSTATKLVDLALERYSLGVTPDGEAYALPAAGGHIVTMLRDCRSSLRAELAREFSGSTKRPLFVCACRRARRVGWLRQGARSPRCYRRRASRGGVLRLVGGRFLKLTLTDVWLRECSTVPVEVWTFVPGSTSRRPPGRRTGGTEWSVKWYRPGSTRR